LQNKSFLSGKRGRGKKEVATTVLMKTIKYYLRRNYFMEYILINFMLFARGNFKNVTIDLAIHSHSASIPFAVHFNCTEKILQLNNFFLIALVYSFEKSL
jgi:hypothetical protein